MFIHPSSLYFRGLALSVLPLILAVTAPLSTAQPSGETRAVLEEVIVTAQRREESLQDTPISIQAFGSQQLETKGIADLVDLHTHVPNFQIAPHPTSSTGIRAFMRGVGNNDDQITQDPSVAIYLDGAYIARIQGLAMEVAEIARIEVLRGPQGTLYGRNATGGAINFVTLAPDVQSFGLKQTLSVGNRNLRRSHTRLNVPLIENELALQLSYLNSSKDGFIDNVGTGAERFGDRDRDAFRLDTVWDISSALRLRYHYDRSDIRDTPHFIDAVDLNRSPRIPSSGDPAEPDLKRNDITAEGHGLTASWDISETLNLKSITTYRELDSETDRNFLTNVFSFLPGRPLTGSTNFTTQDQFSQELQLTGDALEARLNYVAGIYYFEESARRLDLRGSSRSGVRRVTADNEAYALFGQLTYTPDLLESRLHVTAGARWSRDKRDATFRDGAIAGGVETLGPKVSGSNSYSNFSPTLVLAYDLTDSANVYTKWARGYKSGGFNLRASSPERFSEGFDEEQLDSFEMGLKSQWLENRLRVNVAAFHSDYTDIQVNTQSDPADPSITDVLNAGEAVITGAELEVTALLSDPLTLNASYGYLDPEFKEITGADGVDRSDEVTPINAPRHSATLDLSYRFPATAAGVVTANVGYTWQDEMVTSSSNPDLVIDSYGLLNARLTLSEIPMAGNNGDLRISAWGKNLNDQEYYVSLFEILVPAALYGEPRSYGLDITYEY